MTVNAPSEVKAAHFAPLAVTDYVSEVDALRCMAMTGVVALHCRLLPFGWTGVWLFYVISGFAITSSLLASDRTSRSKPLLLRNFYAKRCLRIWPVYFLIVIPSIIAAAIAGHDIWQEYWPWMVTFTVNYYDIFHYNIGVNNWWWLDHLWTISVEEQFYLIFPFLFLFLPRHRLVTALWICIGLGPILRTLLTRVLDHLPVDDSFKFGTICGFAPAHFDAFSAGALLALFRPFLASRLDLARVFGAIALGAAVAYICVYVSINVATLGFHQAALKGVMSHVIWGQGRQIWSYSVIVALASALILLILAGEGWLLRACRLPFLRPIGRISYGAYVYHLPILYLYKILAPTLFPRIPLIGSIIEFGFVYPVTLLTAHLSFRYLEEPVLKLRARFS